MEFVTKDDQAFSVEIQMALGILSPIMITCEDCSKSRSVS